MTLSQWLIFILIIQLIHGLGTWKLYLKAGRQAWEAFVPVYNAVVLMKIIGRPWWWTILLFIPIVNLIMIPVVWVETLRSFSRNSNTDTILVILTLGLYIYYINYTQEVTHIAERDLKPRTAAGEWISSILFAVVAATIVHTYVMQPFVIPTSSLEKTLLVGDFLFVSKFHYGPRVPMTTVALPMVHDTIPFTKQKSFLYNDDKTNLDSWKNKLQLPYMRLPGFQDVQRSDIVVFNYPIDTVQKFFATDGKHYLKPIDKKSNYVKRAVGLPGDSLKIVDGKVFIDNAPLQLPQRAKPQYNYIVQGKGQGFNQAALIQVYDITDNVRWYNQTAGQYLITLTEETAARFKNHPNVASIERLVEPKGRRSKGLFPNNGRLDWSGDNYGSIYIPKKGATVKLDYDSAPFYRRIIEVYEGQEMGIDNTISYQGNQVLLNGEVADTYTFKQDYYWMMGDNRQNSEDSRVYGYVPENHIVGKPVLVWLSWDKNKGGFRWDRMFKTVNGEGEPQSVLAYILGAILLLVGLNYFWKRRKKNAEAA